MLCQGFFGDPLSSQAPDSLSRFNSIFNWGEKVLLFIPFKRKKLKFP